MYSHFYDYTGTAPALSASIHTLGDRLFCYARAPEFNRAVAAKLIAAARAELDMQIAVAQRANATIMASNPHWRVSASLNAALDDARSYEQQLAAFDKESIKDDDATYVANLHQLAVAMFTRDHAMSARQRMDSERRLADAKAVTHAA